MTGCEGWGNVTMWGFSPAIDFQQDISDGNEVTYNKEDGGGGGEDLEVVNILMIGAGDCRHIIKTMAQLKRHKRRKIHIYVIESHEELIGRHLLMLTLAMEPPEKMGLQEKSELFLELYGNSLIRQHTLDYLTEKSALLVEMITDLDYADERMPCIDLSRLKSKERDALEKLFNFWKNPDQHNFNILQSWDSRVRTYLCRRYDTRNGAFDWDLTMKLHEFGAKVICKQEYTQWREKGVGFYIREDGIYDRVNKTLAARMLLMRRDGERIINRGYWGDIVTGPYITFGINTDNKNLLKTTNGKPTKTSGDISLYNVTSLFHELLTHQQYQPPEDTDEQHSKIMEVDPTTTTTTANENDVTTGKKKAGSRESYAPIPCEDLCVHFLPLLSYEKLHEKSKFQHFFNHCFVSASMAVVIKSDYKLKQVFAPNATLSVELVKYVLDLNDSQKNNFTKSINNMATSCGFQPAPNQPPGGAIAKFIFTNPQGEPPATS